MPHPDITALDYEDEVLAELSLPLGTLRVTRGLGSGLSRRAGDPPHVVWAIGDRGPNLKLATAIERYGVETLAAHSGTPGAKLMPCPDIGPTIVELHVHDRGVSINRTLPLRDTAGRPLTGLPPAGADLRATEPALGLDGAVLPPDPGGADTEGLAAAPDGSFWVSEEYGPSLLHVGADGTVHTRLVPRGTEMLFTGATYPIVGALPALAARRRLNRGFEGLALSTDGGRLHLAFQSPLAHPDDEAGRRARHVRLWTLDTASGALLAEYLYPLDRPSSFRRDKTLGDVDRADIKLCDMAVISPDRLLILERVTESAKLYLVTLAPERALDAGWIEPGARPTVEQLSAGDQFALPVVDKQLVFSADDHPLIGADLEGLTLLDARTVLLVNDNDFGIEAAPTRFWRIAFASPLS